jgi:hypothetical protein
VDCVIEGGSYVPLFAPEITVAEDISELAELSQIYSRVPVPPEAAETEVISAGSKPEQRISLPLTEPALVTLQQGCTETEEEITGEHPLASVTVTVYVPAERFEIQLVVALVFQRKVTAEVFPENVTQAEP